MQITSGRGTILNKKNDNELMQGYTRVSSCYDETRFVGVAESFMITALLGILNVQPGMRVLDVAAGTGRTAIPLAGTGAMVMALDLTAAMLAHAQAKARSLNLDNLNIQQANARFLPFPDHTFDVVLSFRFFHLFSLEDQQALLDELHRVAKPGGGVFVEYNNAGALWVGGIFHNLFRIFKKQKPLNRQHGDELQTLYKHVQISRLQGFSWPFMGTIGRLSPRLVRSLLALSMKDRLRSFARFVWVESKKHVSGERTFSV